MKIKQLAGIVIGWRLILSLVALSAPLLLPFKPTFPYAETLMHYGPKAIHSWANFDGVHYLTIIEKGYVGTGSIQAFFPLYPTIVSVISYIMNPLIVGLIISTLSLLVALHYLYRLLRLDYNQALSRRTIWAMLLFPTAFFFTSLYTESIFLLLTVLSLYHARQGKFISAGLFAGLASATRITGIILLLVLIIEWFQIAKQSKQTPFQLIKSWVGIGLATGGLLGYMTYLHTTFKDALLFFSVQSQFGVGRQTETLVMLPQVFWRYLKMIFTVDPSSYLYYSVWLEIVTAVIFLTLSLLAFKKTRLSYAFFALASYLVPTLTGTFTSLPRYVLVIFPAFIVLSQLLSGKKYLVYLTISGILLIINTILFIQGYWIA